MLDYIKNMKFNSYEELMEQFHLDIPENFNFAYDIFDRIAEETPDKTALVWCNDNGGEARYTFGQLKEQCNRTASYLYSVGIRKGDPVMLILKGRYEFWFCILALHKIGAICIPATHLLTEKDIAYRNNAADIKMIITVNEEQVISHVEKAESDSPTLKYKVLVGGSREGWLNFDEGIRNAEPDFIRPTGIEATKNEDILLLYFTSGTTGQPKMVQHNFTYPLGHIVTAKFWQNVKDNGLHYTVADTGWAKAVWGKIYGQWICGSAVFVYDYDKFSPKRMLE
ncbi:MAG: AMP-binding protein, partial [Caldicoprobacterales bacterium]